MKAYFDSLAHRIAYRWFETIPEFIPVPLVFVSEESQQQFHGYMRHVAENICTHPDWLDLPALMPVEHNRRHELCPLFPGFCYTWQDADDSLANDIRDFLVFADVLMGRTSS